MHINLHYVAVVQTLLQWLLWISKYQLKLKSKNVRCITYMSNSSRIYQHWQHADWCVLCAIEIYLNKVTSLFNFPSEKFIFGNPIQPTHIKLINQKST